MILLAAFLIPAGLMAQSGKVFGGLGYYQPGVQFMMPKDINSYLPASFPEVQFNPFMDAGGGFAVFYNFIVGADGGEFRGGTFTQGSTKVDLSAEYSSFKVGYMAFKKKGFYLYPMLGYGTNTMTLFVHGLELTRSFDDLVSNPNVATTLVYKNSTAVLSLSGQYFVMGSKGGNNTGGLTIGFETGYQLPPFWHGEWTYDNGPVMGGPLFDLSGFFFRLSIGGGGLMIQ